MTELVKNIADLKKHIAIDFISGFEVLEYAVEDRENQLKNKYIGAELWAKLIQAYTPSSTSSSSSSGAVDYSRVLWFAQRIIANFALLDYIPEGQLDISENGIRITTSDSKKQAFPWQIEKLEKKYNDTANSNIEALLKYLNDNIDLFTEWTNSPAYVFNKGNFINSATEFTKKLSIDNSHRLFIELLPDINYVEDFYLRSVLGDEFYNELKERIKDGEDVDGSSSTSSSSSSGTQDDEYDKVFHLIKGAVANYTGFEAAEKIGSDPEKCEKKAEHYVQRLVEFLNNNASASLFKHYFESNKYTAPEESESYTSGGGIDNSEFTGVFGAF